MLNEILDYLHNYFVVATHSGLFEVIDNKIMPLDFLQRGQYFRIIGSIFNDGVYCYADDLQLKDEVFEGKIEALAIPNDLLKLADEITAYMASDDAKPTAFTSESFGGYSYSKATDSSGAAASWQTIFAARLRRWRKI
nr:MAG TPA: Protein of unknown function (DUF3199) [Caudoviricetes sp.]